MYRIITSQVAWRQSTINSPLILMAALLITVEVAATDWGELSAAERAELQQRFGVEEAELDTILAILDEGMHHNQLMSHLTYLCEEIGPRLTGSTRLEQANLWAADLFESFGLENVHQHEWGTIPVGFDRGPSAGRMLEPVEREFEFTARAWSAGTDGPVRGPVYREPLTEEEFEAVQDDLAGAWILRPAVGVSRRGVVRGVDPAGEYLAELREAGIAGLITTSRDNLVRTGRTANWRDLSFDDLPDDVTVTVRRSDYDAINSRLFDGQDVVVEFDLDHTFRKGPTIEAARILAQVDVEPKRTIRFILWTGEEQGLLGSRAYVEKLSEEERANISAVFVDDSGTNRQARLTCIEPMVPILERAIEPVNYAFPDMQISLRVREEMPTRGASDHAPFNRVGVPGFFWGKQGRADYRYAWHTQNDRLDQAIPEYLVQSSTASAIVAYFIANEETLLPRGASEQVEGDEEVAEAVEVSG